MKCPDCDGLGKENCWKCRGTGEVPEEVQVKVDAMADWRPILEELSHDDKPQVPDWNPREVGKWARFNDDGICNPIDDESIGSYQCAEYYILVEYKDYERLLTAYEGRGKEIERLQRLRTWDEYPEKLPGGLMLEFDRLDDMWQSLVKELWEAKRKAKCWDEIHGYLTDDASVIEFLEKKHGVK